tara:strand:- start:355 stop:564 length:210 start_codon:yes stop_codon:yes gene_type:complete
MRNFLLILSVFWLWTCSGGDAINNTDDGNQARIWYQPSTDWSGTDTFTYKANDGEDDSNIASVTITVTD